MNENTVKSRREAWTRRSTTRMNHGEHIEGREIRFDLNGDMLFRMLSREKGNSSGVGRN